VRSQEAGVPAVHTLPIAPAERLAAEGRRAWTRFERASARIPGYQALRDRLWLRRFPGVETGQNLFTHFPFLFSDAFPKARLGQVRELSVAALFLLYHILINDELFDQPAAPPYEAVLLSGAYQIRGWQALSRAMGPRRMPWKEFVAQYDQYNAAVYVECRDHRHGPQPYTRADLIRVVSRRCAVSKTITSALCVIGGRPSVRGPLARSLDYYWLADSMLDDLRDWKKDFANNRFSYLLTAAIEELQRRTKLEDIPEPRRPSAIRTTIYCSGLLDRYLDDMLGYLEQAQAAAAPVGSSTWSSCLDTATARAYATQADFRKALREMNLQTAPHARGAGAAERRGPACDGVSPGVRSTEAPAGRILVAQHGRRIG